MSLLFLGNLAVLELKMKIWKTKAILNPAHLLTLVLPMQIS